ISARRSQSSAVRSQGNLLDLIAMAETNRPDPDERPWRQRIAMHVRLRLLTLRFRRLTSRLRLRLSRLLRARHPSKEESGANADGGAQTQHRRRDFKTGERHAAHNGLHYRGAGHTGDSALYNGVGQRGLYGGRSNGQRTGQDDRQLEPAVVQPLPQAFAALL